MRKVARYTSAAPMCFPEIDNYVDGGILAQNPSLTVLTAIQRHFNDKKQKLPISLVVSIGSGRVSDNHAHIGNVDATEFLCFGKHWFKAVRGLTERIKNFLALLSNAVSCADYLRFIVYDVRMILCIYRYLSLRLCLRIAAFTVRNRVSPTTV